MGEKGNGFVGVGGIVATPPGNNITTRIAFASEAIGEAERLRVRAGASGEAANIVSFSTTTAPSSNPTSGRYPIPRPEPGACKEPGCEAMAAIGGWGLCPDHGPRGPEAARSEEARLRSVNGW